MKNVVFWDVALCRSCVNRLFGGTYCLVVSDWWLSLQPPAHAGSPLADFSTLKMEAIRSSETSFDAKSTQRHITEDDILLSTSTVACQFVAVGTCLPSHCLEMASVYLLISWSLHSNSSARYIILPACATQCYIVSRFLHAQFNPFAPTSVFRTDHVIRAW
jgi:hypothetical protein